MNSNGLSTCPQCGAYIRNGRACREKYEEILAIEYESPAVFGAVHHITVLCYNLQHPDSFTAEAVSWMQSSLRAIIEEGLSPRELRKLAMKKFKGNTKVLCHTAQTGIPRKMHWSMTVLDIRTDEPETYIEDVRAWAKSILKEHMVKVSDTKVIGTGCATTTSVAASMQSRHIPPMNWRGLALLSS